MTKNVCLKLSPGLRKPESKGLAPKRECARESPSGGRLPRPEVSSASHGHCTRNRARSSSTLPSCVLIEWFSTYPQRILPLHNRWLCCIKCSTTTGPFTCHFRNYLALNFCVLFGVLESGRSCTTELADARALAGWTPNRRALSAAILFPLEMLFRGERTGKHHAVGPRPVRARACTNLRANSAG